MAHVGDPIPQPDPPHRKRCKRYDIPGHAHYLTFSCFERRPFLGRDRARGWLADAIERARERHAFDLWAYVFMPEHAHLLIWPREPGYSIAVILQAIKQPVARRAVRFVEGSAPGFAEWMRDEQPNGETSLRFWQRGGGYDHNLWTPSRVWEKIDYVHANPLRRGLVGRATDFFWSSAAEYAGTGVGPLRVDRESVPVVT